MLYPKVFETYNRISPFLLKTPVISSDLLNMRLGHEFYFKLECLQKTGAFKVRGGVKLFINSCREKFIASKSIHL